MPRVADAPTVVAPLPLEWDREARDTAWQQYRMLAADDPEAAAVLRAHLEAQAPHAGAKPAQAPSPESLESHPERLGASVYNPTRLYAQVIRACGWTWRDCDETHFPAFFGLVRELTLLAEADDQAMQDKLGQHGGQGRGSGAGGGPFAGPMGDPEADAELARVTQFAQRARPYDAQGTELRPLRP